ncbi:hypothetical protein NHX12_001536 [Muraenolepis orangiensis]|uniref:Uncharacterized protein n=1 Tax=Muraenolepis orangiensis TaxID=630683 RepID=A0A9Q0E4Q9_9TELE|nr:hypothetical protein NHX12_001536 [Muraenolepis orangiensis]
MSENQPEHELLPLPQLSFAQQPPPSFPEGPNQGQLLQGPTQPSPSEPGPGDRTRQWRQWGRSRRRLVLLVLLGSLLCAILILVYCSKPNGPTQSNESTGTENVTQCLSQACQMASFRLSSSVDPFTQPCDYFRFTCGADSPSDLPRQQKSQGTAEMGTKNKEKNLDGNLSGGKILDRKTALMQFLKEALESSSECGSAVQKAKDFYRSCMDTKSIESAGVEPFLTLVQQLGGWGVSDQWNHSDFNATLNVLAQRYASFPFFNLYVGRDPNEVIRGIARKYIQIDEPDLLFPTEWDTMLQKSIAKTQTLQPFLVLCQRYMVLLGVSPSNSTHHVGVFVALSSELARATSPRSYRLLNGQLYQLITVQQLNNQAPIIDWLGCLQAVFHPHAVRPEDHVLLHNLPYIMQMSRVIQNWLRKQEFRSSGPLRTFMLFNLLHTFTPALDSRFRETVRTFFAALGNTEPEVQRWKHCVTETEKGFDAVLTHILADMVSHREPEEMLENIFSIFKSKFNSLHWGDNISRPSVMQKVHSLTPRLWTQTKNPEEIDLLYSKVTIGTRYFSNYIELLSLQRERRNRLFSQAEVVHVLSVRPFLSGNEVRFPLGMFVPPFFHPTYPRAMNYGLLGTFIVMDIFHLLLDDYSVNAAVQAMAECVWAHYLTANGTSHGGTNAPRLSATQQREIWLQYSALHVAFEAYQQSLQKHPRESSLSHLSLSRLFLTAFAQVNCDNQPYGESMPFEPSFLITVLCSTSKLCPATLECPSKTQVHSLNACLQPSS